MTTIKKIEGERALNYYELGKALEDIIKFINDMPASIIREVEFSEKEAYFRIEASIKGVNNRLVELENAIAASEESLNKACLEHYNRTDNLICETNAKLAKLPKIDDAFRLPYGVKEIIETAERFSHLDDEQWQRVIELARALAKKE
ncbi:MAG: hypothetical protein EHM35_15855 [Planctomycetaceae bacterium]|nr:MAG: hypothetical protein EHM35_15855 [Planctomycetaceae bacterium]